MGHTGEGRLGVGRRLGVRGSPPGGSIDGTSALGGPPGRFLPDIPRSILVVMMSAVGDAVQVLPVVNALKRAFPLTRISWLVQPNVHSLVAGHPQVDEFLIFDRGDRRRTPGGLVVGLRNIRHAARQVAAVAARQPGGAFDLVLDLQVYFKAGLLTALAPGRVKLGFDWKRTRDLNWLFTSHRIPPAPGVHAHTQDQYFEFLRFLGVDPEPLAYNLELTPEEHRAKAQFFQALDRPACSVVVASSDPRKDWRTPGYAAVLDALYDDFGLQPILVGGGSPREERVAQEILRLTRVPVLRCLEEGLRRLLWLLDGSVLVISPDTGPLHMARAMEVPVIGLYGFTNPKRSGPYRRFQELIVDGYARHPREVYGITVERRRGGMERITPGMVMEKVELALERYG
ncbi:MAG: glycosyltransferase family 9 protein [Longimicrobiales bacterium]